MSDKQIQILRKKSYLDCGDKQLNYQLQVAEQRAGAIKTAVIYFPEEFANPNQSRLYLGKHTLSLYFVEGNHAQPSEEKIQKDIALLEEAQAELFLLNAPSPWEIVEWIPVAFRSKTCVYSTFKPDTHWPGPAYHSRKKRRCLADVGYVHFRDEEEIKEHGFGLGLEVLLKGR